VKRIRLHTLWCPPLGLALLWREPGLPLFRRILGTIFIGFYSLLYAAGIVVILMLFFGLQYEFRGGLLPYLTFRKTLPDYEKLEASRHQQTTTTPTNKVLPSGSYWNGFRGPNRDGHHAQMPIHTNWAARPPRLLWKQPVGGGYASFACGEGRAYTLEQRRHEEAAVAYDIQTGRELWIQTWPAEFQEPLGGDGPRATPAYEHGRIYVIGAIGELRCLDAASGQLLWRRDVLTENHAENLTYGISASPLILGDRLFVSAGSCAVAYNKETGAPIWNFRGEQAAYSSPMLFDGYLLVVGRSRALGLQTDSGKLLWEFPWVVLQGNRNIAQPVILSSNRFFLSAGYGTGCAAVEVTRKDSSFVARELWRNKLLKNKFTSSVFWNGFIYGLDEDMLVCLDASTGQRRWKEGRYGYGQLLLAGGHLIILSGDGELALVRADPAAHHEVARFSVIQGKTWNHPAIEDGLLLVRNSFEMACFDLRP
jgi:outer membrane protein assembly factor BamB